MQIVRNYGIIMKLEFSRGGKTILTPLPLLQNFRRKEPTMSENQNQLILLKDLGKKQYGAQGISLRVALVECPICKKHYEASYYHAVSGKITKCKGCATTIMKTTHGLRQHILYGVFSTMKTRTRANINYRERGITVCKEWKNDFQISRW